MTFHAFMAIFINNNDDKVMGGSMMYNKLMNKDKSKIKQGDLDDAREITTL